MKITGTFLDEITVDIPSNNWGEADWARDFDAMRAVGIDTVVLIRAGRQDRVTFPSKVLNKRLPKVRECYYDYVDLFLREAERCGMDFYFGTYDGKFWQGGDVRKEIDLNKEFCEEVMERYGDRKAFRGWYLTYELNEHDEELVGMYHELGTHLKGLKDLPILMSPYVKGSKQAGNKSYQSIPGVKNSPYYEKATTLEEHRERWDQIFKSIRDFVDIVAFQDGQMEFTELGDYMKVNCELARKYGITPWSNIETFERGMPMDFLPINWDNMYYKLKVTSEFPVEKLITFEFSHFMSPNSMYPSAHHLYRRYQEYLAQNQR